MKRAFRRRRLRLAGLARALITAGRLALPGGSALACVELTVPVTAPPVLEQDRLWRLTVAQPLPRWRRQLPHWLGGPPARGWPYVTLTWRDGRVFASLARPPELLTV